MFINMTDMHSLTSYLTLAKSMFFNKVLCGETTKGEVLVSIQMYMSHR